MDAALRHEPGNLIRPLPLRHCIQEAPVERYRNLKGRWSVRQRLPGGTNHVLAGFVVRNPLAGLVKEVRGEPRYRWVVFDASSQCRGRYQSL